MAFELTDKTKFLASARNKQITVILEIDGIPLIYSSQDIAKIARIGDEGLLIGNFVIGGSFKPSNNQSLISIKDGTTTNITSQIQQDKSAASSISTMRIALVDKDNKVSQAMSDGFYVDDIISKEANIYLGFSGGNHPEDSVRIFSGNITDFDTATGLVLITVSHPDNLKRQDILTKLETSLTGSISDIDTIINVESTKDFVLSQDSLTSYIKINDEIIEVGNKTDTSFTGCIRGRLGTVATSHNLDDDCNSFYRLKDSPIPLALKVILSGDSLNKKTFNVLRFENKKIFFSDYNIQDNNGLTTGDKITITGVVSLTNETIISYGVGNGESYVETAIDLGTAPVTNEVATFKSKYNTLNFGGGLRSDQVDIEQHEKINSIFGGSFPEIDIYIKDDLNLKEFVENEILLPIGAISVPRKGRISLTYTAPPLADTDTKLINNKSIVRPNNIVIKRNTNRRFYNTVKYTFDEFVLEEKTRRNNILVSADSLNTIRVGSKPLKIEAKGFRQQASNFIDIQSRRFIDRYKRGAESYKVEVTYGLGFNVEVGDIAIFDGKDLQLFDSKTGTRNDFKSRLVEVTNKSLNATTGQVVLELTDTAFSLDGRYTTISPSSIIGSGSSVTEVKITPSYSTTNGNEFEKWTQYIGQQVKIYRPDFSFSENGTLTGFKDTEPNTALISGLTQAPLAGDILSMPDYANDDSNSFWKLLHASFTPNIPIVSGTSQTVFDVALGDVPKLFIGSIIEVHNANFSTKSGEVVIVDINTTTITVDNPLGFVPDNTFTIDLVGFQDKGLPYRYI